MAEPNTHISYSAADIERYLKGGMSAKEMHEMEKTALQDPFLADAIEGYSRASFEQSKKHLNEITAALQAKKEETKIVSLPTKTFYWWRVAAIILLLVGTGTISWFIINSNNGKNEAIELAKTKENKRLNADTIRQKETASAIMRNDTAEELFAHNLSTKCTEKEIQKREKEPAQEKISSAAFNKMRTEKTTTQKIVADSANIGNDVTAGITLRDVSAQDALQFSKVIPGKIAVDSAYPAGGWESFQAYVYKKLNKLVDSTGNSIKSDVELEFSIDDNGNPYNFSVIRSSSDINTSRAIEIVKDGPKWVTTSKKKKGKVTIKF
jgi:hypothetical protein